MEPFISQVRRKAVDLVQAKQGSTILDVATGTGKQAFAFGKKGYDVVGIDLSNDMLQIAIKMNDYSQVKFLIADATNIPFGDNFFDLSCISLALHDMPPTIRKNVLQEMVRVTKSTGVIVIIDYVLPREPIKKSLVYHIIKVYESRYYPEFIRSDFLALLQESGVKIQNEHHMLFGAIRIIQAVK
jgi:demethylmenaquinone methyltransferase/2-methoxy-6-polyprenyl-1,4-benzoquinol methylase